MKRFVGVVLTAMLILSTMGCSSVGTRDNNSDSKKIKVVTTVFPEYDWVREIVGDKNDKVELTLLLDNGTDLHSYQPTTEDMLKIAEADLFIYVGGESDNWVNDALKNAVNKNMKVINLMETLGDDVKEEEIVEGMEADEDDEKEGHDEVEYDEHVWLSLGNAETIVGAISEKMSEIDPENAESYEANEEAYSERLEALDEKYEAAVNAAEGKTILFGDRFPFRYLADDYDISYYAAFAGCSAETEASFETITFLADKVDELSLPAVLTIENSDQKIAKTIIDNTKSKNQKVLSMDSMQSVKRTDIDNGVSYYSIMEGNLEILKEALGVH